MRPARPCKPWSRAPVRRKAGSSSSTRPTGSPADPDRGRRLIPRPRSVADRGTGVTGPRTGGRSPSQPGHRSPPGMPGGASRHSRRQASIPRPHEARSTEHGARRTERRVRLMTATAVEPPRVEPPRSSRPSVRQRLSRWDVKASPYLYITPFFVIFALVGLFPLLYTAWMSLHRWRLGGSSPEAYVGLENYRTLLHDDLFWNALRNTISIFVISSGTQIVFALLLAVLLNEQIRFRSGFRIALLLPYAMSLVAVGIIFSNLFGDQFGFINTVLGHLGFGPIGWHQDTAASHLAIATMVNWRWTGYNALIFLAAMQAIPNDLYEAARIDGANTWERFRYITVPMLRPVIIFVVITSTIGGL